jgi:S1-C subfamily serine protease
MPLVNAEGEVIAVHSGRAAASGSIGLANPIANVRKLVEAAVQGGGKSKAKKKRP